LRPGRRARGPVGVRRLVNRLPRITIAIRMAPMAMPITA